MSAPTQYRMLEAGEVIAEGDEYQDAAGIWLRCKLGIGVAISGVDLSVGGFRRPTSTAPAAGHTPTPWKHEGRSIIGPLIGSASAALIADIVPHRSGSADRRPMAGEAEANAAHIVTCVNQHDALLAENAALREAVLKSEKLLLADFATSQSVEGRRALALVNELRALLAQPEGGR